MLYFINLFSNFQLSIITQCNRKAQYFFVYSNVDVSVYYVQVFGVKQNFNLGIDRMLLSDNTNNASINVGSEENAHQSFLSIMYGIMKVILAADTGIRRYSIRVFIY